MSESTRSKTSGLSEARRARGSTLGGFLLEREVVLATSAGNGSRVGVVRQ
jgi:hypothetical protein